MFRNATAALLTCLLAAGAAFAVQPRVNDSAGFFSPAAVDSANQKIKQISSEFKTDLVIDTVAEVPADMQAKFKEQGNTKFFEEWARKRGADATVKGIYILICKKPGHLAVEIENATRAKAFTVSDRERLVKRMTEAFKEKKYDDGLRAAVDMVYSTLRERVPRKATTPVPLTQKPGKLQPITQKPAAPKKAEAGTSLMGWVCIGLLAVGVIWIIFRVIGAFTGRGQAGPGYGAPGYPAGGGMGGGMGGMGGGMGGGGFMTSLLGGMFGAAAGNWLYDSFRGGHHDTGSAGMMGGSSFGESSPTGDSGPAEFTGDSGGGADFDSGDSGGGSFDSGDSGGGFDSGGFDGGGGGGDF